jgi:hypothetical protein
MQPEEHNKMLGIMHLAYGGMHLVSLVMMVFVFLIIGVTLPFSSSGSDPSPLAFFGILGIVIGAISLIMTIPPLVAGYGFLKRKQWSKVAGAISAVLALINIPMGTALGVYTFWFLFGEKGRQMYSPNEFSWQVGQMRDALHGSQPPSNWGRPKESATKVEYTPPAEPPDWR